MDGEGVEDAAGGEEEAVMFAVLGLWRLIRKFLAEKTLIRLGAVGKLVAPPLQQQWHRGEEGVEGEVGGPEAAAALEAE